MAVSIRCHQGNNLSVQQRELAMSYEKGAQTALWMTQLQTPGTRIYLGLNQYSPDADMTSRRLMGSDNMQWCIKRRILAMAGFCIGQQECSHAVDESRDSNCIK
nr:hypothetical protein CFP56_12114 [Quercus suber]